MKTGFSQIQCANNGYTKYSDRVDSANYRHSKQIPEKAYQLKKGKPLEYMPKFIYETRVNQEGWGEKAIQL